MTELLTLFMALLLAFASGAVIAGSLMIAAASRERRALLAVLVEQSQIAGAVMDGAWDDWDGDDDDLEDPPPADPPPDPTEREAALIRNPDAWRGW